MFWGTDREAGGEGKGLMGVAKALLEYMKRTELGEQLKRLKLI